MQTDLNDPSLFSTTSVWARLFDGDECLYRDHHGRRVLADAEGSGEVAVKGSRFTVLTPTQEIEGSGEARLAFNEGILVVFDGSGRVQVEVQKDAAPHTEPVEEVTGLAEGCGWFWPGSGCYADGSHGAYLPGVAYPFFRSVAGPASVLREDSVKCVVADAFDVSDEPALKERGWTVKNASELYGLDSTFPDGFPHTAEHLSHLNTAQWTSSIPGPNTGIRLRKLYDRFHGRQRARVMIDGRFAGWWYEPEEDRRHRWAWSEFGVDPTFTEGKSSVEITIDPPPASPLWDVSRYEVWALTRN